MSVLTLALPAHLAAVLARLSPGADLSLLPCPHGHCALVGGHHGDTYLVYIINVHHSLNGKRHKPRGGWLMRSPHWPWCPSRTPRRSCYRRCQCPRSERDTPGCRRPGQPLLTFPAQRYHSRSRMGRRNSHVCFKE